MMVDANRFVPSKGHGSLSCIPAGAKKLRIGPDHSV
jgi:hypothetical protein